MLIDQTNEAVEHSFFSMDIQFSSRLSLICGAWVVGRENWSTWKFAVQTVLEVDLQTPVGRRRAYCESRRNSRGRESRKG